MPSGAIATVRVVIDFPSTIKNYVVTAVESLAQWAGSDFRFYVRIGSRPQSVEIYVQRLFICHSGIGRLGRRIGTDCAMEDDMSPMKRTLENEVSAVFERACREQDLAIAEHLLRALEVFAQRDGDDARLERSLLRLVRTLPQRRR